MASTVLTVLLTLQVAVYSVQSQSSCFSGIDNFQSYPLPSANDARYLQSISKGRQVIVPQLTFNCIGYVTAWSAHTLVLTRPNFLEFLTHTITFQVWRPDASHRSYSLVGSNPMIFSGEPLRNGVTTIPGNNDTAFFTFNEAPTPSEQIRFLPGDVVGWFIPTNTAASPLSPLFRDPVSTDCASAIVDLRHTNLSQEECYLCDIPWSSEVISSTVPLVAVTVGTFSDSACAQSNQVCNTTATTSAFDTETTTTSTSSTSSTSVPITLDQRQSSSDTSTVAEIICMVIAAFTLVLHIIMIILCAANLTILLKIKNALFGNAISPETPQSHSKQMSGTGKKLPDITSQGIGAKRNFKMVSRPRVISSEARADYSPVTHVRKEALEFENGGGDETGSMVTHVRKEAPEFEIGGGDETGSMASLNTHGSKEDLLSINRTQI